MGSVETTQYGSEEKIRKPQIIRDALAFSPSERGYIASPEITNRIGYV